MFYTGDLEFATRAVTMRSTANDLESRQGDRVPASILEQCQGDSTRPV